MSQFLPDILQKDEWRKHAFYLIIGIGLLFILFSNPFLKVPFDVWEHLLLKQSYHDEGQFFTFSPDTPIPNVKFRYSWYIIYSTLFKAGKKSEKPDILFIRADLAPIVKGIFRKYVFQRRRNSIPAAKRDGNNL